MGANDFHVVVSGYSSNAEEWDRAMKAPVSELRLEDLTAQEKKMAERFGVSLEDYARGLLVARYGKERIEDQGRALGKLAVEILSSLDMQYRLHAVLWERNRARWMLRIQTPLRVVGVPVPFELADDAIDSGVLAEIERLRVAVVEGVGRGDLLVRKAG